VGWGSISPPRSYMDHLFPSAKALYLEFLQYHQDLESLKHLGQVLGPLWDVSKGLDV